MTLFIVLAVILLAGGGAYYWFFMKKGGDAKMPEMPEGSAAPDASQSSGESLGGADVSQPPAAPMNNPSNTDTDGGEGSGDMGSEEKKW